MNSSDKKYGTGLRVLEVLKILLYEDVQKSDLMKKLSDNSKLDAVYTNEVFTKYFNTLNLAGLKVERYKSFYSLQNALFSISLSSKEKDLLYTLIQESTLSRNVQQKELFKSFVFRLNKYLNPSFPKSELENLFNDNKKLEKLNAKHQLLSNIEMILYDNQLVDIKYQKSKNIVETLTLEIKAIIGKGDKIIIKCYCPKLARNKNIHLLSIIEVHQLPKKVQGCSCLNPVVFELYGRLSSSYKLKSSEHVLNFDNQKLTVSNTEEDKDTLLRRLLKYGENCKILKPKYMKEEFINMTNIILKNLEDN